MTEPRPFPRYGVNIAGRAGMKMAEDEKLWVPETIVPPKVYLAGHIHAEEYRLKAKDVFKTCGIDYIDPMEGERDFRGIEDEHVEEIVYGDLIDIAKSDIVLANFSQGSAGTSMECWYAHSIGRPVVSFVEDPQTRISPWVRFVSETVVYGLVDALNVVKNLAAV